VASAALRGEIAEGRACLRALAELFEARALAAERNLAGAEAAAVRGLSGARKLEHVWLELQLLAELAAIVPSKAYAAEFEKRLLSAAGRLAAESSRDRLREAWRGRLARVQ
jgi:hypothetical protein